MGYAPGHAMTVAPSHVRERLKSLPDINLKLSVGMLVPPVPVILLIARLQLAELDILPVIILLINAIRLIFTIVPLMVVIILLIVICRGGLAVLPILSLNRIWNQCEACDQRRASQTNIEKPFHVRIS